jgi:hypothetical protein
VQRADLDVPVSEPTAEPLDLEQLADRVYRRWLDALQLESARGAWFS